MRNGGRCSVQWKGPVRSGETPFASCSCGAGLTNCSCGDSVRGCNDHDRGCIDLCSEDGVSWT